jgi:hypothetical protein
MECNESGCLPSLTFLNVCSVRVAAETLMIFSFFKNLGKSSINRFGKRVELFSEDNLAANRTLQSLEKWN